MDALVTVASRDDGLSPRIYRFSNKRGRSISGADIEGRNGTYYSGVTVSAGRVEVETGFDSKIVHPMYRVEIPRTDEPGDLKDLFDDAPGLEFFARRAVSIYLVADGETPSDGNLVFVGRVPDAGVERDHERGITFELQDRRIQDDRDILQTNLQRSKFNLVADTWKGEWVPLLLGLGYGQNSSELYQVECAVTIADNVGHTLSARFSEPSSFGFGLDTEARNFEWTDSGGGLKAGSPVARGIAGEINLATGSCKVQDAKKATWVADSNLKSDDYDFETSASWQDGDRIYIEKTPTMMGYKILTGSIVLGFQPIQHPVDVILTLLLDWGIGLGLDSSDVDLDSFDYIKNDVLSDYTDELKCRGRVSEQQGVLEVAQQIAVEFNMRLVVQANIYRLIWLGWDLQSYVVTEAYDQRIDGEEIISWTNGLPQETFKALEIRYAYNPRTDKFEGFDRVAVDESYKAKPHERAKLESRFIPDDGTKSVVASFLANAQGGVVNRVSARASVVVLAQGLRLGDIVYIGNHADIGGAYQLLAMQHDYDSFEIELELYQLATYESAGHWAPEPGETLPDWLGGGTMPSSWEDASEGVRRFFGWLVPDSGENPDGTDANVWV